MTDKPYSAACERNREPILAVLREHFAGCRRVLEIGSGTGQHAVHFAAALPGLVWQTSEQAAALPGLRLWLDEAALANTPAPLTLDVDGPWPEARYDGAFTANTLHILSWAQDQRLFAGLARVLEPGAPLVIYGPFRRGGQHTSPSNAAFDAELRAVSAHRGLRDVEAVDALATAHGFRLIDDRALPAHNACRVWRYQGTSA
ncbi:MAG TPA: DUF938 domain-containing protein [Nevskiaceae bacterium]|nr:DUF938 domain-containing protein [Nevskiaceae bacterium]